MLLIIFVPVIVCATAFVALFLGAAAGGVWEAFEEFQERMPVAGPVRPPNTPLQRSHTHAA